MDNKIDYEALSLAYHSKQPAGKIATTPTKPLHSQEDLSLAYSPGVAGPCRVIHEDEDASFIYTSRSNLVGVISNGTAVLGLGNIGPHASKPVMEGKGMLFKKFANIDVFDIEIAEEDPDKFIHIVKSLEPTFGGINLEDIKAPECFYIEEKLISMMNIPIMHDDQHGTAIIAGAAFLNAMELTGRSVDKVRLVINGAGAAAMGCAALFRELGIKTENLIMFDSKGVLHKKRTDLGEFKVRYAVDKDYASLEEALDGADAFIGVSVAGVLKPHMLKKMAKDPIVFALANPDPEIYPDEARQVRPDVIIATGRSDYPNQVNNVLGFPYIFRGALDTRARTVNTAMKIAAVRAIAALAKENVPENVLSMYNQTSGFTFGRDYLIPKPVDQRVLLQVAPAVAKAAMDSGVARIQIDIDEYRKKIEHQLGPTQRIIRKLRREIHNVVPSYQPRIVLTEGEDERMIRAAKEATDNGDVRITLLGNPARILAKAAQVGIPSLEGVTLQDPAESAKRDLYAKELYELRKRKGVSHSAAKHILLDPNYFATMMVAHGDADGMLNGINDPYRQAVGPVLRVFGSGAGRTLAGVYMLVRGSSTIFFSDCTLNITPSAEELADIASLTAQVAKTYLKEPIRVAMISFSSFGSNSHPDPLRVAKSVEILRKRQPDLEVDGEMQLDVALNRSLREKEYPFCTLTDDANVLIFPDMTSANVAYKLLSTITNTTPTGPILAGIEKPAHVLQRGASTEEVLNMIYVSAHQVVTKR